LNGSVAKILSKHSGLNLSTALQQAGLRSSLLLLAAWNSDIEHPGKGRNGAQHARIAGSVISGDGRIPTPPNTADGPLGRRYVVHRVSAFDGEAQMDSQPKPRRRKRLFMVAPCVLYTYELNWGRIYRGLVWG